MKVEVWTIAEKLAESESVDHYTSKPQIMNHERHITTPTKPNKWKVGWKISRIWNLWTTTPVNLKSWKAQLQPNQTKYMVVCPRTRQIIFLLGFYSHGFKNRYGERTGKCSNYRFYGRIDDVINNLIIIYLNYINN